MFCCLSPSGPQPLLHSFSHPSRPPPHLSDPLHHPPPPPPSTLPSIPSPTPHSPPPPALTFPVHKKLIFRVHFLLHWEQRGSSAPCTASTAAQYKFAYGSSATYFVYDNTQCVELPLQERSTKVGNNIVFFPSYFMEEKVETR